VSRLESQVHILEDDKEEIIAEVCIFRLFIEDYTCLNIFKFVEEFSIKSV